MNESFDIVVIGGGHAGIEAAHAAGKKGHSVLLLTLSEKMIGNTPCNPHIGGSAKGVVVREIDALGGIMGRAADVAPLQIKMLNTGKGPGVQCLRAQVDKTKYPEYARNLLKQRTPNLTIKEEEAKNIIVDEDGKVSGIALSDGRVINAKALILTSGTYLDSKIFIGDKIKDEGPDGEPSSYGLADSLKRLGLRMFRLKTGTPPRLYKSSIDFSRLVPQPGQGGQLAFSYATTSFVPLEKQMDCHLAYTNARTHEIILNNLGKSALFNGNIKGIGPRYCPSIESKLTRFRDKERHQLFIEPEVNEGESIYLQGFSTGLPEDIQEKAVRTISGLENARIMKYAYQIEYEAIDPLEFFPSLMSKKVPGLFAAGQMIGTSGYEEAAGLGLMAGVNASLYIHNEKPFILERDEAYIGVMIDDLTTKGTDEPYRLMSSRAEHRLLLRHDNADLRLGGKAQALGLLDEEMSRRFLKRRETIDTVLDCLSTTSISPSEEVSAVLLSAGFNDTMCGHRAFELLKRPGIGLRDLLPFIDAKLDEQLSDNDVLSIETIVKYEGYIKKEQDAIIAKKRMEQLALPTDLDYLSMDGLALEAREKLNLVRPLTLGQASRISGINPADISIIMLHMRKGKRQ